MSDRALLRLLVAAAVLAAFAPALSCGFVGWDEHPFILDNPFIRGFSAANLRAMLASPAGGVWMPLTWLSYAADHAAWGLEPAGYHLTNVLLHAAAALLFLEVLFELLPKDPRAAGLAVLLWAVHPLRVESVAWAAERKGVLAGALVLASLLARLRARDAAALGLYALALAAKPNVLTYPLALLALETLWLRREPDWRGLAPYAALSGLAFGATLFALSRADSGGGASPPGLAWAACQAFYGLLFYPWKTAWPSGLAGYYPPRPWFGTWSLPLFACALVSGLLAAAARRAGRATATAAACYALLLLPALGLVRHGLLHSAADRQSYLPGLALAALAGVWMAKSSPRRALALVWIAALGLATRRQCEVWRDAPAFWRETARRAPSALADGNYGAFLVKEGRIAEGLELLRASVAADPRMPIPREALGVALVRSGREAEARTVWREALAAAPSPEIAALLGGSLAKGTPAEAAEGAALLAGAVARAPRRADWKTDLGDALARAGRPADAARAYEAALSADPEQGRARVNLGQLLEREGRTADAVAQYRRALRDPLARASAHHDWGNVLLARGDAGAAERHYREAVRLDPRLSAAQVNLGNVLARRGRLGEAAARYRAALAADPRSREARANLEAVTR